MIKELIVARRKEDKHARPDLYSFVVDFKDPDTGNGIRLRDVWSDAAFFIPAGGDTTATALTVLFFYLSRNPDCYKRLVEELRSSFTHASEIRNGTRLASCEYLRACIDEALRITPPIPTTLWREFPRSPDNSEPLIIDGHVIPPGTEVGVNIYSIHHNAQYFPDPFTFRPERWLPGERLHASQDAQSALKVMHEAFTPFSIGTSGCAGKSMAYMEISLVMARTLWYMDFEPVVGDRSFVSKGRDQFAVRDRFGAMHNGSMLVFRAKGEAWRELFV